MAPEYDAFLSYSRDDGDVARHIHARLQDRQLKVFIDEQEMLAGDRWQGKLAQVAKEAPCALILIGRNGVRNWQAREVELFINHERLRQMRIIPVLLPNAPEPHDLDFLALHQCVDLREGVTEPGIREIAFAIGDRPHRYGYKCVVVHPASPESADWLNTVVLPGCAAEDVDVLRIGGEVATSWHGVQQTDFAILDVTEQDAGTMYALGLCHAASRPVIAMSRRDMRCPQLEFGGIGLLKCGESAEANQRQLVSAIRLLREDPSAGDALPRVGLFQQLKMIRSSYVENKRERALAVRWFKQRDQSLNKQIESRSFRLEVADFAGVREWLFGYLQFGDKILATCFTDMSEFYYRAGVGTEYFRLNAAAVYDRNVSMHRVFGVPDDVWRRNDILLRELVDMYLDLGCEVSIVPSSKVEAQLLRKDDFLLICDASSQPRAVIDFELDGAGVTSVAFKFSPDELAQKYTYFQALKKIAIPHTRAESKPQRTADQMVVNIGHLTSCVENSNTVRYIFDASQSDDDIAEYWRGLQGGLIRPTKGAFDTMAEMLSREADARPRGRFDHALVLGSTPEARFLAGKWAHQVTVADISQVMYSAMSKVLATDFEASGAEHREEFLLGDWRGIGDGGPRFDLILAFDSFNMLHTEPLRQLVKSLKRSVKPGTPIIMQCASVPGAPYLQTCKAGHQQPTLHDAFKSLAPQAFNGGSPEREDAIDQHELFARLALSQFNLEDRRLELRPVVKFLNNSIVLEPQSADVAVKMRKTYALCNTTLFFHSHLKDAGLRQVQSQPVDPNNSRWPSLFSIGKFMFQDDVAAH